MPSSRLASARAHRGGNVGACDPALKIAAAATKLRAKITGQRRDRPAIASSKQSAAWAGTDSRWLARAGFVQPARPYRLDDMAHAPGIL